MKLHFPYYSSDDPVQQKNNNTGRSDVRGHLIRGGFLPNYDLANIDVCAIRSRDRDHISHSASINACNRLNYN